VLTGQQAFLNRLADLAEQADRQGRTTGTTFLTPAEQAVAGPFLRNRHIPFSFAGGYANAERSRCLFWAAAGQLPDEADFLSVTEIVPSQPGLAHRDYLGSLLALGLRRDQLGDLLVLPDRAYVVHQPNLSAPILSQLERVGACPVTCRPVDPAAIARLDTAQPVQQTTTVSSLRIDVVLGAIFHHSRSQSLEIIRRGLVQVDWVECLKPDQILAAGQVITVRGSGRARLLQCEEQTRKGKIRLVYDWYA
jgi:RNA-binding protein YlmH